METSAETLGFSLLELQYIREALEKSSGVSPSWQRALITTREAIRRLEKVIEKEEFDQDAEVVGSVELKLHATTVL